MKIHPLFLIANLAISIAILGCESESHSYIDHSSQLPSGFLASNQIKNYKNSSFNCESAIFKANEGAIKVFLSNKISQEFLMAGGKQYMPWEETPINTHDTMVSGKCAEKLFGDEYLKILESTSSYYTSHRQKFLLLNPKTETIYYVHQGN